MKGRISVQFGKLSSKFDEFFFAPASPRPFAVLRIGLALVLIAEALLLRNDIFNLFSHDGLLQGALAEVANNTEYTPKLSWLVDFLGRYGFSEEACIIGV